MKFNELARPAAGRNYEGGEAFQLSPEMELYSAVVTSSLSKMFYEGADQRTERISNLVAKVSPVFASRLAIYAREKMHLRSVPLLLVTELAKIHSGDGLVSETVERVVQRADEIMELLACYAWRNALTTERKQLNRLSHQIQKGLAASFNRFDEYQFAKYDNQRRSVTLRDALFVVHPKAKSIEQQELFDKIANSTLAVPYTWETEFSALGQQKFSDESAKQEAFARKWEELIASGKLGYMALLRNLRNILSNPKISKACIDDVARRIADEKEVKKSRQLPFRYLAAYRELKNSCNFSSSSVMQALDKAICASASNITGFSDDCRVLIAADVSGSMYSRVSPRSSVMNFDIGLLLAMMLKFRCREVISGMFGTDWKIFNLPTDNILPNVDALYREEGSVGYATNGYKVIDWLVETKTCVDKVMIFTDCQLWDSYGDGANLRQSWHRYRAISPETKLYLFDLCGYGQSPLSLAEPNVYLIAGWNEKVFDVLDALENGQTAIDEIMKM